MTNEELIIEASKLVHPKKMGDSSMGTVGSILITEKNSIFKGVCIDTGSGMGFCAEHTAISQMITSQEYKIKKIVAVWKNDSNNIFIVSPCGRCREFMYQINEENLETDIVLDKSKTVKLKELLPFNNWYKKLE